MPTRKTAMPTEQELRDAAAGTIKGEVISTANVSPHNTDWTQEPIERVLIEARRRIGAVAKSERNAHFGFQYRGIDQIIDAVVPVFNQLGVLVTPVVRELSARGGNAIVWVDYWFHGPQGDVLVVPMVGEQSDTTKALSIAWRTALIQTLNLPTDAPDPDAFEPANVTVNRPAPQGPSPLDEARDHLSRVWASVRGQWDLQIAAQEFWAYTNFEKQIHEADAKLLRDFADQLEPKPADDYTEDTK